MRPPLPPCGGVTPIGASPAPPSPFLLIPALPPVFLELVIVGEMFGHPPPPPAIIIGISFNDTTVKFIEQSGGNRKRKMSKRKTLKIKTRKKSKSQSKSHSTPLLDEKIHHKKHKNSARNKH